MATNTTLKTTSGSARFNIHGALNIETFDTPFVAPITVDGVSAVQLLAKIEAHNQDKRIIHVIWDNAAYPQRAGCQGFSLVQKLPHPPDPVTALLPTPKFPSRQIVAQSPASND